MGAVIGSSQSCHICNEWTDGSFLAFGDDKVYCLTVGYPLGLEIIENRLMYQVSINNRTIRLLPIEYRIWSRFLLGADEKEVEKTLSEQDHDGFIPTINKLFHVGLLQRLSADFSEMKKLIFFRQGIGIGQDLEQKVYHIVFRDTISLDYCEYAVWKEANGSISFGELEQRLILKYKFTVEEIRNTTLKLCRKGILITVNREEGEE